MHVTSWCLTELAGFFLLRIIRRNDSRVSCPMAIIDQIREENVHKYSFLLYFYSLLDGNKNVLSKSISHHTKTVSSIDWLHGRLSDVVINIILIEHAFYSRFVFRKFLILEFHRMCRHYMTTLLEIDRTAHCSWLTNSS